MDRTPAKFIEDMGDATAMAKAIGTDAARVRMWKHRNRIPRHVWPELQEAYPDVTVDVLKAIEAAGA